MDVVSKARLKLFLLAFPLVLASLVAADDKLVPAVTTRAVGADGEESTSPSKPLGLSLPTVSQQNIRSAAARAVALVERTSAEFLGKRECFTCHTQTLSVMVLRSADRRGFDIDKTNFKRQYERSLEDSMFGGVRVDTVGYALWALDLGQYPADDRTEKLVQYLLDYKKELGIWKTTVARPPAEASHFTTNYVAIRGLHRYGCVEQQQDIRARAEAIRSWMKLATVADTEDHVFRLRLAHELKLPRNTTEQYVNQLLEQQHDNGGWSQTPEMQPDAYATGSVLVAMRQAGGVRTSASWWQAAVAYLLRTQNVDGSWQVATRAKPLQEYFESGFPHGKDQFLSAFATGWATESLLLTLPPLNTSTKRKRVHGSGEFAQ